MKKMLIKGLWVLVGLLVVYLVVWHPTQAANIVKGVLGVFDSIWRFITILGDWLAKKF